MLLKFTFEHKKVISFLLILCTVFSMCSQFLTVFAVGDSEAAQDQIIENEKVYDFPQAEILELDANDVPELIDFNEAKEKGHVLRLREKETDDHTVIFLNDDNTETMYIFAEPIKYTDSLGEVCDKSRTLSLVEGNYTMTENDVLVNFPSNVSDGITASKGEYTVSMVPIPTISETITTDTTAVLANNKVIYSDVFGTADVLYTPLYSGFKEDIILESYNGVNEFNFFVYTNGLIPIKNENGSVSFFDPDTSESVAEMMQVVCYDANNKFAGGDVVITEIKENQIYGFTVIADAAFLADENTAYPVSVDPTLNFSSTTAIEDAVVYSGKPSSNFGNYQFSNIGYLDSSYKKGELLIKFPTLKNSTVANLDSDQINSATLQLYPASRGSGTETIEAFRYNATWNESTITWNGLNFVAFPVLLDTVTVPSNTAVTTFNITQAVKTWLDSDVSYISPDCGIILANNNESDPDECRDFLSTEYASLHSDTGMPRLEVSYSVPTTVTVLLLDGDDDSNNIIEIAPGIIKTFEAYIVLNGIQHSAGTSLTFASLDPVIAEITGTNSAGVRGISKGQCAIRATYNGLPRAYSDIVVRVYDNVEFVGTTEYVFNTHSQNSININLRARVMGELLSADSGIAYSIDLDNSYGMHLDKLRINASTGVVSPITSQTITGSILDHPIGNLCVRASYTYGGITRSQQITVKVVCEDYAAPTQMVGGNCIIIDYPYDTEHHVNNLEVPNQSYDNMIAHINKEYNQNTELIKANFLYNDGWLENNDSQRFFELIRTSKISVILTHGNEDGSITVNSNIGTGDSINTRLSLSSGEILSLPQGYFNNCELIILLCCYGGDFNMCEETYNSPTEMSIAEAFADRGAKRVIGFNDTVSFDHAEDLIEYFFGYMGNFSIYGGERPRGNEQNSATYEASLQYAINNMYDGVNTTEGTRHALDGTAINNIIYREDATRVVLFIGESVVLTNAEE